MRTSVAARATALLLCAVVLYFGFSTAREHGELSGAFAVLPPKWQGASSTMNIAGRQPSIQAAVRVEAADPASSVGTSSVTLVAGAMVLGALVAALFPKADEGASPIIRFSHKAKNWKRYPQPDPQVDLSSNNWGPDYYFWCRLQHRAWCDPQYKTRYIGQRRKIQESGLWYGTGKWHKWYPNRAYFNMYKGPESHPNNPFFPAASPGQWKMIQDWPYPNGKDHADLAAAAATETAPVATQAVRGWAAAPVAASVATTTSNAFVRGFKGGLSHGQKNAQRSAMIMHAHKKAASSSKNQGGGSNNAKHWGLKQCSAQGAAVKVGQVLAKQKGKFWHAGQGVKCGRTFFLQATCDGIVQWRGYSRGHKELSVVPWDYVRSKCDIIHKNVLVPKEYEPYMGKRLMHDKKDIRREYINDMREEWMKSEKGLEWLKKKEEKIAKQRVINKKVWAFRKMKAAGLATQEAKDLLKKKEEGAVFTRK